MSMGTTRTWNPHTMVNLLSQERMNTYLQSASGDLDQAFALYRKNMQIAGTLQMATAMVEVVARNAIDHAMVEWNSQKNPHTDWFDLPLLDSHAQEVIHTARGRARHAANEPTHGEVITEISFGFWRFITSKRYLTALWIPALQHAFPYGDKDVWTRQKQVSRLLNNMTFIRNRAAHLEPVFKRDTQRDIAEARRLLSWVSSDAAAWFDDTLDIETLEI